MVVRYAFLPLGWRDHKLKNRGAEAVQDRKRTEKFQAHLKTSKTAN